MFPQLSGATSSFFKPHLASNACRPPPYPITSLVLLREWFFPPTSQSHSLLVKADHHPFGSLPRDPQARSLSSNLLTSLHYLCHMRHSGIVLTTPGVPWKTYSASIHPVSLHRTNCSFWRLTQSTLDFMYSDRLKINSDLKVAGA